MPSSVDKIKKAIGQINTDRAPGKDGIPAEVYKAAKPNTLDATPIPLWRVSIQQTKPKPPTQALRGLLERELEIV